MALKKDTSKDDIQFEYVEINRLIEDPSNPNVMTNEQLNAVKENIANFGFIVPIVINDNYEVADGEHRLKIAKEMGITTVPCIKSSRLNDDIARRIARQALNKVRGEHEIDKDVKEIEMIINSHYKGAAQILQKVSLIGRSQYDQMKKLIQTGGIAMVGGQFTTEMNEEGRFYDKFRGSRRAESYLTGQIKQIVIYFTADDYPKVIEKLDKAGEDMKALNNSEIIFNLLDHYEKCQHR